MPVQGELKNAVTDELRKAAEEEIRTHQKIVDYNTKEYIVEILVERYLTDADTDQNEIYVPDYQRDFVWDEKRQSKFIESVMLGLPIPFIFTASVEREIGEDEGRVEIVDGSQRIRTLAEFVSNRLVLTGLEKLKTLNGFRFEDLDLSRRRKFNRVSLRVIELSDKADEEVRRDLFERINTGSAELSDMEKRFGSYDPAFMAFLKELSKEPLFMKLCPISKAKGLREESAEMVLRYFAYADDYLDFDHSVKDFLNDYAKKKGAQGFDAVQMRAQFLAMLGFANKVFSFGFAKSTTNRTVPRVRFESMSAGITLALRQDPELELPASVDWAVSEEFKVLTASDASNSRTKVKTRIEYVRDKILGIQ